MTYVWKVIVDCEFGKIGDIIEVEMPITKYDDFKAEHSDRLERYLDTVPAMTGIFGTRAAKLPNTFVDRMKEIRNKYPGAKGMLNDSKFNWSGEH